MLYVADLIQVGHAENLLTWAMSHNCISFISQTLQSSVHAWLYINMHMATKHTTPTNTLATFIHLRTLCSLAILLTSYRRLRTCARPTGGHGWLQTKATGGTVERGGAGPEADPGGARRRHRRALSSELAAMAGAPARKNRKSQGKKKGDGAGGGEGDGDRK